MNKRVLLVGVVIAVIVETIGCSIGLQEAGNQDVAIFGGVFGLIAAAPFALLALGAAAILGRMYRSEPRDE